MCDKPTIEIPEWLLWLVCLPGFVLLVVCAALGAYMLWNNRGWW